MKKLISLLLVLILVSGVIGCSTGVDEEVLEQEKIEVQENAKEQNTEEKAESEISVEQEEVTSENVTDEQVVEESENVVDENKKNPDERKNDGGKQVKKELNQEEIELIIELLDEKVEEGELTSEERDKLVQEVQNGDLKNVKGIIEKK